MINEVVNGGLPVLSTQQPKAATPAAALPSAPVASTSDTAPAQEAQKKAAANLPQLQQAVSKLNDYVQNTQRKLSFSVSAETGQTIVKVYDTETDELIRQIPSEETIRMAESIDATVTSLFVKERA